MSDDHDPLDFKLRQLIAKASEAPLQSHQRRKTLSTVVRLVDKSGRLWRENSPDYEEALQITWLYLCGNPEKYDPSRGKVMTWINNYLKFSLKDLYLARKKQQAWHQGISSSESVPKMDLIEAIPSPPDMLERTKKWIETDPQGILCHTYLKDRPDVNCQILLLQRFPPPVRWKDIAQTFSVASSVAPMFYQRKCLPILRQFGDDEGYL